MKVEDGGKPKRYDHRRLSLVLFAMDDKRRRDNAELDRLMVRYENNLRRRGERFV